jgi:predicted nucleic acid-binding protein
MKQGKAVDLTEEIALEAARLSFELKVPMAASIILAAGRRYKATIWTLDQDFQNLAGVKYIRKS